jgi:hypothetical protein
MTQQSTNYDDVKQYRLDPDREQELVNCAGECTFCWANKAGHPLGVTTAYVPVDGKIWMYKLLAHGMSKVDDSDNDFTMGLDPELFVKFLDTPERIVLEFTPEMSIPFDGDKMAKGTAAAYAQFAAKAAADD